MLITIGDKTRKAMEVLERLSYDMEQNQKKEDFERNCE